MSVLIEDPRTSPATVRRAVRRPEVDGLRALAVALVVIYHVFTGRVSGGVDVFLVLSGFFLVLSLSGRIRRTGRVQPLAAVARTLSRLVPPALLVLAATVAVSVVVVPPTRWREIASHLLASVTFTENHRLVHEAVDYSASNALASPMQQFWSLSIQVQVLVAVPVVVAVGAALLDLARWRAPRRPVVVLAVAAVTAASFAWSVVATADDQQAAYFSTLPRLWELGAGALLALLADRIRPGRWTAALLGWTGVLALVACGALVDGAHRFPGWAASWPVLCAAAVLVAGGAGGRFGVHRVLAAAPVRWLGSRSYALYLWHWPVLVLYLLHTTRDTPSAKGAAAVVLLSLLLAEGTYRLVEQPAAGLLQGWRPVVALAVVVACALPLVATGTGAFAWFDREAARVAAAADDPAYPGATALLGPEVMTGGVPGVSPIPSLTVVRDDWPALPDATCVTEEELLDPVPATLEICAHGGDDRDRRVLVVGDSHMAHWLPPLADIGDARSWQVVSLVRGGCNLSTESEFIQEGWPEYEECAAWRARLVDRIVALEPDLVLALGTRTGFGPGEEYVPPGFLAAWEQLSDAGVPVVGLRDTPRHPEDVPDCQARWGDTAPECTRDRSDVYTSGLLEESEVLLPPGAALLDTSSYFCTSTACPPVVGNLRVYMDFGHVTATYMRSVRPLLEPELLALTGW